MKGWRARCRVASHDFRGATPATWPIAFRWRSLANRQRGERSDNIPMFALYENGVCIAGHAYDLTAQEVFEIAAGHRSLVRDEE